MEPIQHSLRKITNKDDFKQRWQALKEEVLEHKAVQAFIHENASSVDDDMINRSMGKLYEFINQHTECRSCESLQKCDNLLKGFKPKLTIDRNLIDIRYERCEKKVAQEERKQQESLIQCWYMPKEVLRASMGDVMLDDKSRMEAVTAADYFIENYKAGELIKGLYMHGPFGVGKTYILGAIANELSQRGIQTMLINMPEFSREIKGSIQDQSLNSKVDAIKKVPVLMLDDIGAETMSSWFRDDILGTILQHRMMEHLPVFFTSNLSYKELEHHFTYSQRGEVEGLKAARVMERIQFLTKPIKLAGKNYRHL